MIREKTKHPNIRTIKPFFWKECRFCHREFRKEKGFAIKGITINGYTSENYCCGDCCKDINEVAEKIANIKPPQSAFVGYKDNSNLNNMSSSHSTKRTSTKDVASSKTNDIGNLPKQPQGRISNNSFGSIDNSRFDILLKKDDKEDK